MMKSCLMVLVLLGASTCVLAQATQNGAFNVPQISAITVDGSLSDWTSSTAWSDNYVWWNGTALTSTTQAKFAWNDASDMLYVAIQTNQANGGWAVVGHSKTTGTNPMLGDGSTQLGFGPLAGNDVSIKNEIKEYAILDSVITGVEAKYSLAGGVYTYEIAIPFYGSWAAANPQVQQTLSNGETVYLYSVMQDAFGTADGNGMTYFGNPAYYAGVAGDGGNNAWLKASALTLVPEPCTLAVLGLGGLALIRRKR